MTPPTWDYCMCWWLAKSWCGSEYYCAWKYCTVGIDKVQSSKGWDTIQASTVSNLNDSGSTSTSVDNSQYNTRGLVEYPDSHLIPTYWEAEEGSQISDVQGRLHKSLDFWLEPLEPALWIVSCIKEGYKLPLRAIPHKFTKPNQQSAISHTEFVTESLQELEQIRHNTRVFEQPHVCSPLSVVENRVGKLRLVLNLLYVISTNFYG